jgi:tetratricopeptide (TPR) repeat protein
VTRGILHIVLLFLVVPTAFLRAQWYESYGEGLKAVKNQHWQQAVNHLTEALDAESDSKANKRMYGLQFIDYFPYLYRGIAYYKLGDLARARADLEKEKSQGAIEDARNDAEAPTLLTEYLNLVQKPAPPTAQQKTPQNPAQNPPQNTVPAPSQTDLKKTQAAADQKTKRDQVESAFSAGKDLFSRDDLDRAEEQFKIVLGLEPNHRGALNFMNRIQTARQKLAAAASRKNETPAPVSHAPLRTESAPSADTAGSTLFKEAVALLNGGKIGQAKLKFQSLQKTSPSYPDLANYMAMIATAENKVHVGIQAFFHGEYREAIEQLRSSSMNGHDNPHVYAFLACSYAAEYFLAGAENRDLKREAVAAFGKVKGIDPRYELDPKLISPGIIALLTGE